MNTCENHAPYFEPGRVLASVIVLGLSLAVAGCGMDSSSHANLRSRTQASPVAAGSAAGTAAGSLAAGTAAGPAVGTGMAPLQGMPGAGGPGDTLAAAKAFAASMPMVRLPAGELAYYPPGDFLQAGKPVNPQRTTARLDGGVEIMKHQVSQADYALCVADGGCKPLAKAHRDAISPTLPVVGVSWRDATDFAAWLSRKTGRHYRLPTYQEWVYAAGSAYKEDVLLDAIDPNNPAALWLAEYDLESQRKSAVNPALKPFGSFGVNENGLQDMAGNVWDWTNTCHQRIYLDANGKPVNAANNGGTAYSTRTPGTGTGTAVSLAAKSTAGTAGGSGAPYPAVGTRTAPAALDSQPNCGLRVVAGPHRSYITDFIRDPKGGACSVGIPPSNLGFRLVRENDSVQGSSLT